MKNKQPLVSVVMPVYNAGPYIVEAIESILHQTYQNFEFIIVDDASTDNSWEILKAYKKRYPYRIRIYRNKVNLKQGATVERAMKIAKGEFIARMDADDIALPYRLEKQLTYLLSHKETVALGGQCILIDKDDNIIGEKRFPTAFVEIYRYIFQFIPVQQPTFMVARKRLPKKFEFYNHKLSPVEDVEALFRLFCHGKVENVAEHLLYYRIHQNNSSRVNLKNSFFLTLVSRIRGIFYYGYRPTMLGIATTLAQAIIIFLLPQKLALFCYDLRQKKSIPKVNLKPLVFEKLFAKVPLGI